MLRDGPDPSGLWSLRRRAGDGFLKAFFPRQQWNSVSLGVRRPLSRALGSGGQALGSTTNAQALYLLSSQRCIFNHVRLVLAGLARGGRPRGRLYPGETLLRGWGRLQGRVEGPAVGPGKLFRLPGPDCFPSPGCPSPYLTSLVFPTRCPPQKAGSPASPPRPTLPKWRAGSGPALGAPRRAALACGPGPGGRPRGTAWRLLGRAGARRPGPGSTRQRREGRAGKRGSRKRVAAAAGPLERRERRRREGERGGGRLGGRRERGRQAEGGLISMQQRSRARLHCFNTSPLLRANLSPFSRRTLLPQMLLFSNETDN